MEFLNPKLYSLLNIWIVFAMAVLFSLKLQGVNNSRFLSSRDNNNVFVTLYVVLFIIVVGLRPLSPAFVDMLTYSRLYYEVGDYSGLKEYLSGNNEILWALYVYVCYKYLDITIFFFIVEVLYVGLYCLAIKRLFDNKQYLAILLFLGYFSFFSYATNTIRAGLAMSFVMLSFSYLIHRKSSLSRGIILSIIAFFIHTSSIVPIVAFVISRYFLKNYKIAYILWFVCIIANLLVGVGTQELIVDMFAGQDARVQDYLEQVASDDRFNRTGFRWDFILFSSLPILLGWYVLIKKRFKNDTYLILLNTYTIANAFWILVNRAAYSDRFAYLSWFMYPVVIAYPLLEMRISKRQARLFCMYFLGVIGFTLALKLFYYE